MTQPLQSPSGDESAEIPERISLKNIFSAKSEKKFIVDCARKRRQERTHSAVYIQKSNRADLKIISGAWSLILAISLIAERDYSLNRITQNPNFQVRNGKKLWKVVKIEKNRERQSFRR